MNERKGFFSDAKAVSPVIAVLVLIVVAVIGAIGVGTLQTQLQAQTTEEAKIGELGATEVRIIGGPAVSPMMVGPIDAGATVTSEEAPEGTMLHALDAEYPKININFLRECCGFAMYALPNDACDMGMGRRFPTSPEKAAYPELQYQVIGKAPIAVITNATGMYDTSNTTTYTDLADAYTSTSSDAVAAYAFDSAHLGGATWEGGSGGLPAGEVYGTSIQGMFSLYLKQGPSATDWIQGGADDNLWLNDEITNNSANYELVNTPEEMIDWVATTATSLGFVDYMYAVNYQEENPDVIVILGLDGETDPDGDAEAIGTADTTNSFGGAGYVTGFGGPMFTPVLVTTYGDPDPAEQKIIDYMAMFHGVEIMSEHGFLAGENTVVSATCPFHTA